MIPVEFLPGAYAPVGAHPAEEKRRPGFFVGVEARACDHRFPNLVVVDAVTGEAVFLDPRRVAFLVRGEKHPALPERGS